MRYKLHRRPEIVLLTLFVGFMSGVSQAQTQCSLAAQRSGELHVQHCRVCGASENAGTEAIVRVEGIASLPGFVTQATAFLNGWRLAYQNGAHKITGILASIQDITLNETGQGRQLAWQSVGTLRDQNFDDAYELCTFASVVGWNTNAVTIGVNHDAPSSTSVLDADARTFSAAGDGSALTAIEASRSHPVTGRALPQPRAVVLPRGFEFVFTSSDFGCFDPGSDVIISTACRDDNDLLQLGFHLGHAEGFDTATGAVDTTLASWISEGIMKDNDARRDYRFSVSASTLGGLACAP